MDVPSSPKRPVWFVLVMGLVGAVAGGFVGVNSGEALVYALARLVDRDIAELKGMLIWATIFGLFVGIAGGIWIALLMTRAAPWARRTAMIVTGILLICGAGMMSVSYDWPKASGYPVVDYEIRLPAGAAIPEHHEIDVAVWAEKDGHGASITDVRQAGGQAVVAGSFLLDKSRPEHTMSLRLRRAGENHWTIPIASNAPLDKSFGPWQRVTFIPTPRANVAPLPSGDYEVRYRVRRYM